jgi:hypothetical protein
MGSEHDIFIGFAPATGNENQVTTNWTLKFCDFLTLLMNRISDRKLTFLTHDDLRVRQSVLGENPGSIYSNTAIFIVVLSPEYMKSINYLKELDDLYNYLDQDKSEKERKHRIFKVFSQPVPVEAQPDCLKNELSYNFYEINRYNKKPVTFELNSKEGPNEKFWSKLVDLAYDITDVLNEMSGKTDGLGRPSLNCPAVFLAETTFDQQENRDKLKRELQYSGYRILPVLPIPEEAEKAKQAITQCLNDASVTIHLLGSWYGDFIKNSKLSFIDFQIKTVKDYIASKETVRKPNQIIWIPNDIKPTDQRQSLYLKRLQRDEAQYLTEIIETPFEVFKTLLNSRLAELKNPPAKLIAQKNKLYVIYEKAASEKMSEYNAMMRARGFEVLERSSNDEDNMPITKHINNLLSADAVLIYKGESTMDWLNSKIRDLVKAPGFGKSKPFRAVEIISGQKTADKSLLFLKNVPLNWDEEINHEVINHFLDHLAKK